MSDVTFRIAGVQDSAVIAAMNEQLIRDEGHRNSMTMGELTIRMSDWLGGDYEAVLFSRGAAAVGYALYRRELEHVYLRQFFVAADCRRQGIGRSAMNWLWEYAWMDVRRLRLDVLIRNAAAHAFWESVGFSDYCVTMESERMPQ